MEKEIWKDIPGFEGRYRVSNLGKASSARGVLKQESLKNGYMRLYVSGKRIMTHRLILLAFLGEDSNKKEVNHKNGVRSDNRLGNIEWCTHSENCLHRSRYLGKCKEQPKKRRPVYQFDMDGNLLKQWDSMVSIYAYFGKKIDVWACCNGRAKTCHGYVWKYV